MDRANHYRAATPLALVCDATTRVRFPVDEGATIGKSRGSISPPDVGVETSRWRFPIDRELSHGEVVSAFRGSTYFRRTGTAALGVFFGRSARRLTSGSRAAAGLEIASGREIHQVLASAIGPGWEQVNGNGCVRRQCEASARGREAPQREEGGGEQLGRLLHAF